MMVPQPVVSIQGLVSDEQCYETVRGLMWSDGTRRSRCHSRHITKRGHEDTRSAQQKYECKGCGKWFDDPIGSVSSGHRRP